MRMEVLFYFGYASVCLKYDAIWIFCGADKILSLSEMFR